MKDKILSFFSSKNNKNMINDLYGENKETHEIQKKRYLKTLENFKKIFKTEPVNIFSTPGRTEIIGNHTDHNLGKVVAASITIDSIAFVAPTENNCIDIFSGFYKKSFKIMLDNLNPLQEEIKTTEGLIRGVAAGLKKFGFKNIGRSGGIGDGNEHAHGGTCRNEFHL